MSNPRALMIVRHCRETGGHLRKGFIVFPSGHREVTYFLEPGTTRVAPRFARGAIDSGWLAAQGCDLFGDPANAQVWVYAPKPATR
jgi:hypothetical protein